MFQYDKSNDWFIFNFAIYFLFTPLFYPLGSLWHWCIMQELSLIQKSFREGLFHCDSQLFARIMYVFIFKIYSTQISRNIF